MCTHNTWFCMNFDVIIIGLLQRSEPWYYEGCCKSSPVVGACRHCSLGDVFSNRISNGGQSLKGEVVIDRDYGRKWFDSSIFNDNKPMDKKPHDSSGSTGFHLLAKRGIQRPDQFRVNSPWFLKRFAVLKRRCESWKGKGKGKAKGCCAFFYKQTRTWFGW